MPRRDHAIKRFTSNHSYVLTVGLLVILWISGGASRADAIGQVFTRGAAWAILISFILLARRPNLRPVAPVAFFVLGASVLVASQLIPLPPSIWTALPGRHLLEQAAIVSGQEQPWRPLSIAPGATVNALSSLIVPVTMLFLMAALDVTEQWRVATLLLGLVFGSTLLGLLQFSGARFDHPLINDIPGMVSASFANRNHFALFAAIGCILAPAWGFREGQSIHWKGPVAIALLLLFALIILATGSRTGMLLGALGIGFGLCSVRRKLISELRRLPKAASIGIVIAVVVLLTAGVLLSIILGRAVSLDRILTLDASEDLRRQALPTVVAVTRLYFPFGSGVGTFDPVYRIHERDELLSVLYFNHAHNDLLEVVLDAGLAGLLLLGAAALWWLWKSVKVWRVGGAPGLLARLGSGILLLILIASVTDYPARTPMIMAVVVIAAVWLSGDNRHDASRVADSSRQRDSISARAGRDR